MTKSDFRRRKAQKDAELSDDNEIRALSDDDGPNIHSDNGEEDSTMEDE